MGNPYAVGHRSVETLRLQKALNDKQIDVGVPDGIFGRLTQAGVEAAQQRYSLTVTGQPDNALLAFLGLADAFTKPRSNPINDFLTGLVVKTALNQLVKGLPAMNVLAGAKTIIVSSLLVVVGVLELFGIYIDQFGHTPPGVLISAGLIGIFMRLGISNAITKALTDGVSGLGK